MKNPIRAFLFLLAMLLPIAAAHAAEASTCWKDSYGRGFALVPNCGAGEENSGGLCYPKCKDGYVGVAGVCWQACPKGWEDIGVSCTKPNYSRPTFLKETLSTAAYIGKSSGFDCKDTWPRGYLSTAGKLRRGYDPIPSTGANAMRSDEMAVNLKAPFHDPRNGGECWVCPAGFERSTAAVTADNACSKAGGPNQLCEKWSKDNGGPGSCEESGGLLYPRPATGVTCTANSCAVTSCPSGYRNDGLYCAKTENYTRAVSTVPKACQSGYRFDAGLCYPECKAGFEGVGPVCWGQCTGSALPFECGAVCAKDEMTCGLSTAENIISVLDVIVTVSTTAASMGAGTAVKAAIQKAIMEGAKKTIQDFAKKKLSKAAIKTLVINTIADTGKDLPMDQTTNIVGLLSGEEFDFTTLDPTGISGIVKAYNKPKCSTTGSTTAANASGGWTMLSGLLATDVAVGANGSIWAIGADQVAGGSSVHRWNNGKWEKVSGAGKRIAVDPNGKPWLVNDKDAIYRWNGSAFEKMPGAAKDIAIGSGGAVWVVGTQKTPGGYSPNRWTGSGWTAISGGVTRLAVQSNGNLAALNENDEIFAYDGSSWTQLAGKAKDVAIGGNAIFILGDQWRDTGGGWNIQFWNGSGWSPYSGELKELAVKPDGKPMGVNAQRQVYEVR